MSDLKSHNLYFYILQSENATSLLTKPGSGENKQDEMRSREVHNELPEEYGWLEIRTCQNFVDAWEHQRTFTNQTVSQVFKGSWHEKVMKEKSRRVSIHQQSGLQKHLALEQQEQGSPRRERHPAGKERPSSPWWEEDRQRPWRQSTTVSKRETKKALQRTEGGRWL